MFALIGVEEELRVRGAIEDDQLFRACGLLVVRANIRKPWSVIVGVVAHIDFYDLTRKRNRRPMPAMRAGKVLRFYWSEVERWLRGGDVA